MKANQPCPSDVMKNDGKKTLLKSPWKKPNRWAPPVKKDEMLVTYD